MKVANQIHSKCIKIVFSYYGLASKSKPSKQTENNNENTEQNQSANNSMPTVDTNS
jgi:hypothetical protein